MRIAVLFLFVFLVVNCRAQVLDSSLLGLKFEHFEFDSFIFKPSKDFSKPVFLATGEYLEFIDANKHLLNELPNQKNYRKYYELANALLQEAYFSDAERMYKKILDVKNDFYALPYWNGSDIPGDNNSNFYGYGSTTFHFKHRSCLSLTELCLAQNRFEDAEKYLSMAENVYPEQRNCGTGYRFYRDALDGLWALVYEGLGCYDEIVNMFLADYDSHGNGMLVRALKQIYSIQEIELALKVAVDSMVFEAATEPSIYYIYQNFGKPNEMRIEHQYFSGVATTVLFGREVVVQMPSLEDGGVLSKEQVIEYFLNSAFYNGLIRSF